MEFFSLVCDICGTVNQIELTHCVACGQVLGAPSKNAHLLSAPTASALSNRLLKQRYRILHVIGRGGMGMVYIGVDTELGNRLVAIKEMTQRGLTFAEQLAAAQRFQQEAHLLASLQHPNLPSIYDHFSEDQRWYLVMSFIKGQTLEAYLQMRGGRLGIIEVVEMGLALCSVLQYLHTYRPPIIFRDLKPANIMRTLDGHIYLIDFGIARVFKPGQMSDTTYQGSAGYAPPEQYGATQTNQRSDIYSLGVTLYHLLTGYEATSTPFHLPPLQSLLPNAPEELVTLITAMLELNEEKRPESAEIVRWELQNIGDDLTAATQVHPITLPPSSLHMPKAAKRSKSTPIAIFAGVALLSALALFLVISNINASNINASSKVITNFCDAFNLESPDFQTAYQQFSANYRNKYSLTTFETLLRGASNCTVIKLPDANYQAQVSITMPCFIPPLAPTPPPNTPSPRSANTVYLTLIPDGGNNWQIDMMSFTTQICSPPPRNGPFN